VSARARWLLLGLAPLLLGGATPEALARYLHDPSFRRAALEASLPIRTTRYARLRLERYASGDAVDWDLRPEWNPRTRPVTLAAAPARSGALGDRAGAWRALELGAARAADPAALRALGEQAFFNYPAQLAPYAHSALTSRQEAARFGLWRDGGRIGGLVRVVLGDGSESLALTCATCHVRSDGGRLWIGAGSERLDLGRMMNRGTPGSDPALVQARAAWGPGRVDVTTGDGRDPVRIPDLRPIRWLTHLHYSASVAQRDPIALAVRIETLIITAHGGALRPPREVALGLALYLWSLADTLPERAAVTVEEQAGRVAFDARCASCHRPPGFTGPPVDAAIAGTDPRDAHSPERGTGRYRVPSLRGVATRGALLHDGSAPDLAAALPADLDARERQALLAYLRTL